MMIAIASAVLLLAAPLLVGLIGWWRGRAHPHQFGDAWPWPCTIGSALLFTLAFNLTFFIQELFLVVPKALTPGLRPILYHNNHSWSGGHPLASLFQGTGALAILISGVLCGWLLTRGVARSFASRLFLIWMTYCGVLMALPQVVAGALNPGSDVGMAMEYLRLSPATRTAAAVCALAAIPAVTAWLTVHVLRLAEQGSTAGGARDRSRFVLRLATLPALLAIPLILLFRIPRELIEVVAPPVVVVLIGVTWMQAWAWWISASGAGMAPSLQLRTLTLATLALLLVFQFVLRPGIPFF